MLNKSFGYHKSLNNAAITIRDMNHFFTLFAVHGMYFQGFIIASFTILKNKNAWLYLIHTCNLGPLSLVMIYANKLLIF